MDSNSYVYNPLSSGEIRLLTLLPGTYGQPLLGQLAPVILPEDEELVLDSTSFKYEALSYMWGTSFFGSSILHIEGYQLPIKANLNRALRRLRRTDKPRILWIDAICINQDSISERNEQVGRMRHIYRQAKTVLIWLGDEGPAKKEDSSLWITAHLSHVYDFTQTTVLARVIKLCCARYWRRLWIVQELLSARRLVVHCGPLSCDWRDLVQSMLDFTDRQEYNSAIPSLVNSPIWPLVTGWCRRESLTLRQLLLRYGDSQCQDPRDRIYGLVGIASDCQDSEIPIDYSTSMAEIFDRVMALYPFRGDVDDSGTKRFVYHLENMLL